MVIILPGEHPVSWNKFYAGTHWTHRRILVDSAHASIELALRKNNITHTNPQFFKNKINITIHAYYYTRTPLDSDNIPAKIYIDGLKGLLIVDDSPKYVGNVTTRSIKVADGGAQRVEIIIEEDIS